MDRKSLAIAGGKAANLGELVRAGLPVPPGLCVTTAAYTLVAEHAGLGPTLAALAPTPPDDITRLAELAAEARAALLAAPVPAAVAEEIAGGYQALGVAQGAPVAVAVRSSATAEDLPEASFAGQQDTYLNVVGAEAVLDAVRRCWASLWTDRVVSYRARNGIDHGTVRLAVVIQCMVDAAVAGVLFTANPLTGRRRQAVIDASPGLGEAIVSGAVNPDHFVVDPATGTIVERRLGDKQVIVQAVAGGGTRRVEVDERSGQACLTDAQVRALAALGARVEAHYGAPQDLEWAIDAAGQLWLLQARPITTLFPLPASAPASDDDLRVYFSINVIQGVFRPFTPMGIQTFRLIGSGLATGIGLPPRDPLVGPGVIAEAAQRLFLDLTPVLRSPIGRRLLGRAAQNMETRTATILTQFVADPRLAPSPTRRWGVARTLLMVLARTHLPLRIARALLRPSAARERATRIAQAVLSLGEVPPDAGAAARLAAVERLFRRGMPRLGLALLPLAIGGLGSYALAGRLLRGLATADERQTVLRGLPHNPTTEMDLALWVLAQRVREDEAAARALDETSPTQLAADYHHGVLPPALQQGLATFLRTYGHRGVAEIDLGLPRWAEDPTHILGALANYLQLDRPALAPDAQFRRGAEEAEAMVTELARRADAKGWLRGQLVRFCLRRVRALAGLREAPKFYFVALMARARALLWPVGEELARAGRLDSAADIFFVTLPEARAAVAGADLRPLVHERRAGYQCELNRRHVPRVLLSDGTEPAADGPVSAPAVADAALRGAPASAGVVTARARVILDPVGARLEPGEILVAPSTDPGWTPLFLTAGGLVMEMGGAMSHGAVVARECGIPAVVGVPNATERITTGQWITVDGSSGRVSGVG
ncbi:MAG: phosphoenolpyruvate synthase [Chloroflexi bacterium]|nr:phosphoenolpyruvate synthase [Chloroflexota bacterium]